MKKVNVMKLVELFEFKVFVGDFNVDRKHSQGFNHMFIFLNIRDVLSRRGCRVNGFKIERVIRLFFPLSIFFRKESPTVNHMLLR